MHDDQTSLHLTFPCSPPLPTNSFPLLLAHTAEVRGPCVPSVLPPQDPGEEDTLQVPPSKLHKGWGKIRAVVWRQGTRRGQHSALQSRCQGGIQQKGLWQEMDESGLYPWVWGAFTCLRIQAKPAEGNRRWLQLKPSGSVLPLGYVGDSLPNLKGLLEFLSL